MVVHAGAGVHSGTLVNALLHRFAELSGVGGELRPGIVHRLDRFTSGVLLVAKNDAAHRRLAAQFAGRRGTKDLPGAGAGRSEAGERTDRAPDRARSGASHAHDGAPGGGPRGVERVSRAAAIRAGSRSWRCASAPGARTRSACTWRASSIRWWATRCTARRRSRSSGATSCMRTGSSFSSPVRGEEIVVVSPAGAGAGGLAGGLTPLS